MSAKFHAGFGVVSEPVRLALRAQSKAEISRMVGVTPQAVCMWDRDGKLPPLQAIRLHKDHGVPLEKLYPLIEGL